MTVGGIPQIWFMPDDERDEHNMKRDYQSTLENPETHGILNRIQVNVNRRLTKHQEHVGLLFAT